MTALEFMIIAGLLLAISPMVIKATRRLRWFLNPNHAPLRLEGRWLNSRQLVVRCTSSEVARGWIEDPPTLELTGLEGLAWLAREGDRNAAALLFEILSDDVLTRIEQGCQNPAELRAAVIAAIGTPELQAAKGSR